MSSAKNRRVALAVVGCLLAGGAVGSVASAATCKVGPLNDNKGPNLALSSIVTKGVNCPTARKWIEVADTTPMKRVGKTAIGVIPAGPYKGLQAWISDLSVDPEGPTPLETVTVLNLRMKGKTVTAQFESFTFR